MTEYAYIVRIEGIGTSDGQTSYCYPKVPTYAAADPSYVAGIAEVPNEVSGHWNPLGSELSVGRFSFVLHRYQSNGIRGPVNFLCSNPPSITEIREDLTSSDTTISHAKTNARAGIVVGSIRYMGRETLTVTVATAGAQSFGATRGVCGSTAATHPRGEDIYTSPPALAGRYVAVYRTIVAGVVGDETLIGQGYLNGEPASGINFTSIEIIDRFVSGKLGDVQGTTYYSINPAVFSLTSSELPHGNASGGYWYIPALDVVFQCAYGSGWSGAMVSSHGNASGILYGNSAGLGTDRLAQGSAYQVLCSKGEHPSFRYFDVALAAWLASDCPIVIAMNLLASLNGSNYDAGDEYRFDLGATTAAGGLYPTFSVGVPRASIDYDSFVTAWKTDLADIHASEFWLGGAGPETILAAMYRLFAPLGYSVGCNRAGKWTLIRLRDVYPGSSSVTVPALSRAGETTISTLARSLDSITLQVSPGPSGKSVDTVIIDEESGRRFYPEIVGEVERIATVPYAIADLIDSGGPFYGLVSSRVRRLATRLMQVQGTLDQRYHDLIDLGTALNLGDPCLVDPTTGENLTAGQYIQALVTDVQPDFKTRIVRFAAIVISSDDTSRRATISPSADVESWADPTLTVTEHVYTHDGAGDGARFVAGDKVTLIDTRGVHRSARTGAYVAVVDSSTDTTVVIHTPGFRSEVGSAITPNAGDILVFADYDDCQSSQTDDYAHVASGGGAGYAIILGSGDDPYTIGD